MEAHFVHNSTGGEMAVIGFPIQVGSISDPFLDSVLSHIGYLQSHNESAILPFLDFSTITQHFAQDMVFRYSGSLTTPPCSEGIEWIVSSQPLLIDEFTFNNAKKYLKFNSRYIQNSPGQKNLLDKTNAKSTL
ncbi:unnamed protein product [Diplocarpon coronariae]